MTNTGLWACFLKPAPNKLAITQVANMLGIGPLPPMPGALGLPHQDSASRVLDFSSPPAALPQLPAGGLPLLLRGCGAGGVGVGCACAPAANAGAGAGGLWGSHASPFAGGGGGFPRSGDSAVLRFDGSSLAGAAPAAAQPRPADDETPPEAHLPPGFLSDLLSQTWA